ncbi:MAG: PadR family transcriptional regulator, partial [Dermatophilaceae bacterium]
MTDHRILPGQLLHGVLELSLLALLIAEEDYGYGLAQRLAIMGFGEVPGGTLYPALLRLGRDGLVDTSWRP